MEKKKYSYVLVYVPSDGETKYWPYPEVQDFCLYDLSNDVVYLTFDEMIEKNRKFRKKVFINGKIQK